MFERKEDNIIKQVREKANTILSRTRDITVVDLCSNPVGIIILLFVIFKDLMTIYKLILDYNLVKKWEEIRRELLPIIGEIEKNIAVIFMKLLYLNNEMKKEENLSKKSKEQKNLNEEKSGKEDKSEVDSVKRFKKVV